MANERQQVALVVDTVRTHYPNLNLFGGTPDSDRNTGAGKTRTRSDAPPLSQDEFNQLLSSDRWDGYLDALGRVGNCAHPIKVVGQSTRVDAKTGEVLGSYSSAEEKLGVTYLPCGNRRAAKCPHCSRVYARDVFQLIRAGVTGGKTVPDQVRANPLVFATFTAPPFGKVHTRSARSGACHPRTNGSAVCRHGRPRSCTRRHGEDDAALGQPLCPDCYDYGSQVVWGYWAPKLWGRFTMALRRAIAAEVGIAATKVHRVATVQFVKVAEDQRRAAIHYHALIRLDGSRTPDGFQPAPPGIDAARLAELIRQAGHQVRLTVPGVDAEDPERVLAFGHQLDTRIVAARNRVDDPDQQLSAGQVGGYLAKYVTKSSGDDPQRANNAHHQRLRATVKALAARAHGNPDPVLRETYRRLGRRVEENGYRGHRTSKSRRFSVTLGQLRRARQRAARLIAQANRTHQRIDLAAREAELLADEAEATVTLGQWTFAGTGWATNAETTLAVACAARAREYDQERAAERRAHNPRQGAAS